MNPIQTMIAQRPMSRVQVALIILTGAIMAVDGFDFLSVALVSKALAAAWSLNPRQLGLIFAAGTTGMTLGTFLLSPLADIWGRRLAIICCLIITSTGMLLCSAVNSFPLFIAARVLTGLGVGGLGSHVAVLAFEYASYKTRERALAVTIIGFTGG